jgi:cell division septation protein DedD
MDPRLKQRLVGAAVLVALAVIFLPMLVKGPAPDSGVSDLPLRVPEAPETGFRSVDLPLLVPAEAPAGGVLPVPDTADGALPTVDTADEPQADATDTGDPLPPTVAGGDYAVHYGSFGSEADARTVLRQLGDAGLTGYVEAFVLNGRAAQRVRLGPYATRAEAEIVRLRAASLRDDVSPRVVALDAESPAAAPGPARPVTAPVAEQPKREAPPAQTAAAKPQPPAAETGRAAATAPAAPAVGFVVQLGAFSKAADATALRDRLRAQGIVAFTETVDTDKGRLTRVKAGPVAARADAERLKAQVKAKVGVDGLVRQHP